MGLRPAVDVVRIVLLQSEIDCIFCWPNSGAGRAACYLALSLNMMPTPQPQIMQPGGSRPRPHVVRSYTPQLECREGFGNPLLPPVCITRFSKIDSVPNLECSRNLSLHVGVGLDLEMDFAVAGAVEFAEEDGLPAAEQEPPALDQHPLRDTDQR